MSVVATQTRRGGEVVTIEVGMGATYGIGSDSYPYTVVEILSPCRVVVQRDNYRRTDNNGLSECQEYAYTPNPEATRVIVSKRRDGRWRQKGETKGSGGFYFGERRAYQDPSF